jgi:hypothetical protein
MIPIVDFVIGGTQKGGTTALDAYLREHPEICMATKQAVFSSRGHPEIRTAGKKEVHFFDTIPNIIGGSTLKRLMRFWVRRLPYTCIGMIHREEFGNTTPR